MWTLIAVTMGTVVGIATLIFGGPKGNGSSLLDWLAFAVTALAALLTARATFQPKRDERRTMAVEDIRDPTLRVMFAHLAREQAGVAAYLESRVAVHSKLGSSLK
jgi:hypothetical protein